MKDYFSKNRTFVDLIPSNLRDETNTSLMNNLFDRFLTKDESIPLFGYIGSNSTSDPIQKLPQMNLDREVNQLIATYVFSSGNQKHYFTPHDFMLKLKNMGVRDPDTWLMSKGNNYVPPINLEKFVNFYEYFWVGNAVKNPPVMPWNKSNSPEYYVIAKPNANESKKLSVVATVNSLTALTGSGYYDLKFIINFGSALNFTITAVGNTFGLLDGDVQYFNLQETPQNFDSSVITDTVKFISGSDVLLTVVFTRELIQETSTYYQTFYKDDKFIIESNFLESTYSVNFNGSAGDLRRGGISSVRTLNEFQIVDGVQVREGDRVLVRVGPKQGIFEVRRGDWISTADSTNSDGDFVYCRGGNTFSGHMLKLQNGQWIDLGISDPTTNDWQEFNMWVHKSAFDTNHGYDLSRVEQARRPIIEYWDGLQLNSEFNGFKHNQSKNLFNQIPMFDIFEYDGTPTGIVSPIFFYVESPSAEIDLLLQKRVKKTDSEDFLFDHGLLIDGKLRFYKHKDSLRTIWANGYSDSIVKQTRFYGVGDGTIELVANSKQQQQILSITCTAENTFTILSSKYDGVIDTVTVGTAFSNKICSGKITNGQTHFKVGDYFLVMISGAEQTRIMKSSGDSIVGDFSGMGAFKHPRMFTNNPLNENAAELREGSLYGHFRSILINQISENVDYAFGGSIKSWDSPVSLLSSLMMQKDVTPLSIVDFAKREYSNALNNLNEIYFTNILKYIQNAKTISSGIVISDVTDYVLGILANDYTVKNVFNDTSSGVTGFPISLAKMGFVDTYVPQIIFDGELSSWFIQHHDGHLEPAFVSDSEFLDILFEKKVKAVYPGLITDYQNSEPTPAKGKVWRYTENGVNKVKVFCVEVESSSPPAIRSLDGSIVWKNGDVWYETGTNNIHRFNASTQKWVLTNESRSIFWKNVDFAEILNQVILEVETRLFKNVDKFKTPLIDVSQWDSLPFSEQLREELAEWAFQNKLDPTANNFDQTNPFTWNYSNASISTIQNPAARWFDLLKQHHSTCGGVIPTERPDLYPWRLLGYMDKPTGWDTRYAAIQPTVSLTVQQNVTAVDVNPNCQISGTRIIDNVMVKSGDVVIISGNYVNSRNGVWIVRDGSWESVPTNMHTKFVVSGGTQLSKTEWFYNGAQVVQLRTWTTTMWDEIKNQRPTLKLSVNKYNDRLLPPYVNPTLPVSSDALLTVIPSGITLPFKFGDKSPVESIWMKSIEFPYALAKAFFKYDPLQFLELLWGINFVSVDGLKLDANTNCPFSVKTMANHGDSLSEIDRSTGISVDSLVTNGSATLSLKMVGFKNFKQVFHLIINGETQGYMVEGAPLSITVNDVSITNLMLNDNGTPFRIGDEFTIKIENSSLLQTFTAAPYVVQNGFSQLMAQSFRFMNVDHTSGYSINAMQKWEPYIGYRVGGYLTDPDYTITTSLDTVPSSAVTAVSKKTSNYSSSWITALRVSTFQVGANSNRKNNTYIPNVDGSDWVFRIDGFNKHHNTINFYTFNKSGHFNTFNALEKAHTDIDWKQYTDKVSLQTVTLPITIVGVQNVLNFVFGYEAWLREQGWNFDEKVHENVDKTSNRFIDFQLLLEKFVDGVYAGGQVGRGEILNPIATGIWFDHEQGVLSTFIENGLFDPHTDSAAYDMFGTRISIADLRINRMRERSLISANMPIFSIHAEVDSYEHLMVFNRYMDPVLETGALYEPFQGSIVSFLKINGKKQSSQTLRPEVGGYVMSNDSLVRNFESSISAIGKMYDANSVFEDNKTSEHALALYGYSPKTYMSDMDYTEKTQFNFWRGMVHLKGTNLSFDAFKNGNRFDDAKLDEYWAFKIAEYGDARVKICPEVILNDIDCQQQFTKLTLNGKMDETFTQINSTDESKWFSFDDVGTITEFQTKVVRTISFSITQNDVDSMRIFKFENYGDFVSFSSNLIKLNQTSFIASGIGDATVTYSCIDFDKHSPLTLINYVEKEVVQKIPVWHPAVGLHNPQALSAIDVISNQDPAMYNYSTIIDGNVNYDEFRKWGKNETGMIWFDTTNLAYLQYNNTDRFGNIGDRLNRWGALAEYSNVNISEWIESDVHPADYAVLSNSQNNDVRTDGVPYKSKMYQRSRIWHIAPIAWSKAGVPNKNAHPSFNSSYNAALNFRSNGVASLETGTFSGFGITAGMRIGAWRDDSQFTGPLNEFLVTDEPNTKFFMRNDSEFYTDNILVDSTNFALSVEIESYTTSIGSLELIYDGISGLYESQLTNFDGTVTGQSKFDIYIGVFLNNEFIGNALVGTMIGGSGNEPNVTLQAGTVTSIKLPNGLSLRLQNQTAFTGKFSDIALELENFFLQPLKIEDGILLEQVTFNNLDPSDDLPFPSTLVNDPNDPRFNANFGCGWRAWSVPTQDDLDNDAIQPNSIWRPYVGPYSTVVSPSLTLIDDAIKNGQMTLNDGTKIERYSTSWSEWSEMRDFIYTSTSLGGDVSIVLDEKYDQTRLFVYKNGIRQPPGAFELNGSEVIFASTVTGDELYVRVSMYEPSADELKFNPDVDDDLKKQDHYKRDYEFVENLVRSSDGAVIGSKYYFWVTGKSTTTNKLPTNTIENLIINGPTQFAVFPRNDSIVLYGLNYLVTRNNTFKLRLVNDNTLRSDPNGLDLKDVHQEWKLIRKGQREKVPSQLWDRIVDSMCGSNIAGEVLPFRSILEYDSRNNTETIYGFGDGQVIAPRDILVKTVFETITNSKVTLEFDLSGAIDFISSDVLDWNNPNEWFDTPDHTRKTMESIWFKAKPSQINEIVFAAIEDACAYIKEMTHLMKTSRMSAYSIKIVQQSSGIEKYE